MKTIISAVVLVLSLAACANLKTEKGALENVPACSPDGSEGWVLSKWTSLIAFAWEIAPRYVAPMCKGAK